MAIKLIPPSSPAALQTCQERFLAAMEVLAAAGPPTFPALLDHGFTPDGSAFMVMEFVECERLDALIGAAPARILGLTLEVAQGIAVLARAGMAHGNLSPENIASHRRAGVEHVCILGFGTAAFHGGGGTAAETAPPAASGRFTAPERVGPSGAGADWRADLYAIAATCCALLRAEVSGGDDPTVTLPQVVASRIPGPAALAAILGQALRADPAARPASLEEFRQAMATALSGPGAATTATRPETPAVVAEPEGTPDAGEDTAPARVVPLIPVPAAEQVASAAQAPVEAVPADGESTGSVPTQRLPELPAAQTPVEAVPADGESTGLVPTQRFPELPAPPDAGDTVATALAAAPEADSGPEAAAAVPAEPPPGPPPAGESAAPAAKPRRSRTALWAAGAATAVVLAAAAGALWYSGTRPDRTVRTAAPTPAPRRPTSPPAPAAVPAAIVQLQMAEAAIALGDLAEAQSRLDAISPAEIAALAPADRDRFKELRSSYLAKRQRAATREIQSALAAGNMAALAGALRGLSRADEAAFPRDADFIATVEDARRALDVHAALLKAQRQGRARRGHPHRRGPARAGAALRAGDRDALAGRIRHRA